MLVKISDAIWMQIAINTVGIAMLTAVSYCRSRVEEGRQAKPACRARSRDQHDAHPESAGFALNVGLRTSTSSSSACHRISKKCGGV